MSENTCSSRRRKALSVTLAVAMAATMLLSGTLAYYYSSKAVNTFSNEKKVVVGHDDFVEGVNKDVYVENLNYTPVYVRVKLTEDFVLAGKKVVNPITPVNHVPIGDANEDANEYENLGKHIGSDSIHEYFTWEMGQKEAKYFRSAKDVAFTKGGVANIVFDQEEQIAKDGSGKEYSADDQKNGGITLKYVEKTSVITMAKYNAMSDAAQRLFTGWVADTNGWYYWSQMLQGNQMTGLLLDNVKIKEEKKADLAGKDYVYNINVTFQAVDETDKGLWRGNGDTDSNGNKVSIDRSDYATEDAQALMEQAKKTNQMTTEFQKELDKINMQMDSLNSAAAKHVYQTALDSVNSISKYGSENMMRKASMYQGIGDAIEEKHNDPTELAKLKAKKLLERSDTGNIIGTAGITDAVLAQGILDEYDFDSNGCIDGEEALAVTSVNLTDATDLTGLTTNAETGFPNFKGLTLYGEKFKTTEIDLNKLKGLEQLTLVKTNITKVNLAPIADTLRNCYVLGKRDSTGNKILTMEGLGQVQNLEQLVIADLVTKQADINSCLANGGIRLRELYLAGIKMMQDTTNQENDASRLDLKNNTELRGLTVNSTYSTGKLDVSENLKLTYLCLTNLAGTNMTCSSLVKHTDLAKMFSHANVTTEDGKYPGES